jgi:hypothetical protein
VQCRVLMTATPSRSMKISPKIRAELLEIASDFRRKLDVADKSLLPEPFRDFPKGSCGAAAKTLGLYIRETLQIECTLINAGSSNVYPWTHSWLEYGNLIIDVTADQFGKQPPVWVTTDRSWHQRFGDSKPDALCTYDAEWIEKKYAPVLTLLRRQPAKR